MPSSICFRSDIPGGLIPFNLPTLSEFISSTMLSSRACLLPMFLWCISLWMNDSFEMSSALITIVPFFVTENTWLFDTIPLLILLQHVSNHKFQSLKSQLFTAWTDTSSLEPSNNLISCSIVKMFVLQHFLFNVLKNLSHMFFVWPTTQNAKLTVLEWQSSTSTLSLSNELWQSVIIFHQTYAALSCIPGYFRVALEF